MNTLYEKSAGCVLIANVEGKQKALLIRIRANQFELPKGHVEVGETDKDAALRELVEETGLVSKIYVGEAIGEVSYSFNKQETTITKHVVYFSALIENNSSPEFGKRPKGLRELKWVSESELENTPLISEELYPIIRKALS